jgi:DNA replication protein DnaC
MDSIKNIMQQHGFQIPDNKVNFQIDDAKQKIVYYGLEFVPDFDWIAEYDGVVDWLSNNEGKGLFMYGDCGRGKTILAKYIIPAILLTCENKVLSYFDIQECKTRLEEIKTKKLISLDDVGTEEVLMIYGNKIEPFSEIMDTVEKNNKLIVITSNLSYEQLLNRYGVRVIDRIKATTKRILFKGASLRG